MASYLAHLVVFLKVRSVFQHVIQIEAPREKCVDINIIEPDEVAKGSREADLGGFQEAALARGTGCGRSARHAYV